MVLNWQLWLSPRPRRTDTSSNATILAPSDKSLFEFHRGEITGDLIIRETHYIDNPLVKAGLSGPALHIHLLQNEYFKVEKGVLAVHMDGKEYVLTAKDGTFEIPTGSRHRFCAHASCAEDLVFKVWAEPQTLDGGFDENFLRHIMGYLRDCQKSNVAPSIFQLMLFMESAQTVMSPPFWMPVWLLSLVHRSLAYGVGSFILGYKERYPEYSTGAYNSDLKARKTI